MKTKLKGLELLKAIKAVGVNAKLMVHAGDVLDALNEAEQRGMERAAKLMEAKFHKVSKYPTYHPKYDPANPMMLSPFADAIRKEMAEVKDEV